MSATPKLKSLALVALAAALLAGAGMDSDMRGARAMRPAPLAEERRNQDLIRGQ